jgi:tRNA nucleotidyltransferase (CCA-adding enzyme)
MPEIAHTPDGSLLTGIGAYWEHFPHVADIGIRGFGPSPGSAFAQAAKAMTAAITDPGSIEPKETIAITCQAPNTELLLVDWLNAILYEMATRKMLFAEFDAVIHNNALSGTIKGEPVDVERHAPATEVKGATLSELEVIKGPEGLWRAQCIVDV